MLVLARKQGERVLIGSSWVEVVEIRGNSVKLGIHANSDVEIWREELVEEPAEMHALSDV